MTTNLVGAEPGAGDDPGAEIIIVSSAMRQVEAEARQTARTDAKILLTGESGVGKEVLARLIHRHSVRKAGPFVAINCAGVPDTLLESELFGHVRGSFTGAHRDKPGLIEQAHGGTIFMDEIGEMSARMQTSLLRFFEDGEVHRVGAERRSTRVSVRVVAATNHTLPDRIAANAFRADLYYRLNVIQISIPPLRERREDIEPLLHHFMHWFGLKYAVELPSIAPDALFALLHYEWPGNVRELRNVMERLIVCARNGVIEVHDLPQPIAAPGARLTGQVGAAAPMARSPFAPDRPSRSPVDLFDRLTNGRESFWTVVHGPFMIRDLTRDDVRAVVSEGLRRTRGNYAMLPSLFNIKTADRRRFLHFLRKYKCRVPAHSPNSAPPLPGSGAGES